MAEQDLAATAVGLRPFVPARDFAASRRFYDALGFQVTLLDDTVANVQLGHRKDGFAFLLQDFYVKEWAENFMMHLLVEDLDRWSHHIGSLSLAEQFEVQPPRPPRQESWGLRVAYVWDPAGVLWHIASRT